MAEYYEKAFLTFSKQEPFNTWLIADSSKAVDNILKNINAPVLTNSVTTLKSFAKHIVSVTHPELRIINTEEQFIVFSKIASHSGFSENGKRPSATLINQLIYIYNTEKTACIKIPSKSQKHEKIIRIIDAYEKWSDEHNICDSFSVIEKAIDAVENGEFKIKNIIAYKVRPSNKLADKFFNIIKESAEEVLTYDIETPSGIPETLKPENIVRYKDAKTEIKSVLEKICVLIENGVSPKEILVLTPSISKTAKLVDECVSDFYYRKDCEVKSLNCFCSEQGTALANTSIVKSALAYLSAVTRDYKLEDLEEILLSPFFTDCPTKITAGDLREMSIVSGVDSKKSDWLNISKKLSEKENGRYDSKSADITIFVDWLELSGHENTLAEHCKALKTWLKKSGWSDFELSETEYSARSMFLKLIDSMQTSVSSDEKTDLSVFYSYLLRFSLAKFAVEKEKEDSFYLAKLTSASSMKADYVFIVGLSADNIPNIPSTLPPFSEKETDEIVPNLKSDMFESEDLHFRTALFSAEKELYLSCAKKENGKNLIPSSFITKIFNSEPREDKIDLEHSIFENQKIAGSRLIKNESCEGLFGLTNSDSVISRVQRELSGGCSADFSKTNALKTFSVYDENTKFAPTVLEAYADCPFKWYLKNHLRLYSAQESGSEVILIGVVVHRILQRFFIEFKNSVTNENKKTALEKILEIASDEFGKIKSDTPEWIAKRSWYLGEGLPGVFEKFIEYEAGLSEKGWATPSDCVEKEIDSKISMNGRSMNIHGKIDRVLVNGDCFKIMDYKTGSGFTYNSKDETHFQIPLYACALSNSNGMKSDGGLYLQISSAEFKEIDAFKNTAIEDKTEAVISKCFEIADSIKNGQCDVKPGKCDDKYCSFKYICRHVILEDSE